jgi:aquaporin Z
MLIRYLAEMMGTFTLVLMGCGAAVISGKASRNDGPAGIGVLGIALAFGLAVVVMAYAIGPISGCHINPAVSLAMFITGKIGAVDCMFYILAQLVGATLGALMLNIILDARQDRMPVEWGLGANGWGAGYLGEYTTASAFAAEAVFTFIFVFVILGVTSKQGDSTMAGLAIGLSLALVHLAGIPITGTSANPARSFGPAVIVGGKALKQLWLFIVAPLLGAVVAASVWLLLMP